MPHNKLRKAINLICSLLTLVSSSLSADSLMDGFIDPQDGKFDVSHYLAEKKGFFPIPIIVTEPAVGYGAGAALVFLHDPLAGRAPDGATFDPQSSDAEGKLVPPSISAMFGLYTENETWFAGGAHLGVWKNDNVRYLAAAGTGSVNMKFYGLGQEKDLAVDFNLEPTILYQGLKFRLAGSGFFAGIDYVFVETQSEFDATLIKPGLSIKSQSRDAAVGVSLEYDSRDTIFTPSSGINAEISVKLFDEAVGGDSDYQRYRMKLFYFTPLRDNLVLGLRGDAESVEGSFTAVPFFQYPFVNMRGIPAMRYQGQSVLVGEAELRWNFTPRWSLVGFGGAGRTNSIESFDNEETVTAGGAGLRYFIARRFGAHVGFDIARGPEDTAFYLQFGHSWR